jgi:16S rRNA (adenine1518-N6/adenine1519-N6)-dimethyltransferase
MLGAGEITRLLDVHGLTARRSLGQNFVVDPSLVRRIAREAGVGPDSTVLEVGPGLGSLTLALVEAGAHVVAVEKDPDLLPVLGEVLAGVAGAAERVTLVPGDALEVDLTRHLPAGVPVTMVANLPYNVAVPVVLGVLERLPAVDPLVVMVQREVADRIVAGPGGRTIGIPSVKVAWYGSARMVMTVPPEVFVPRPRVESAVLRIDRRPPPPGVERRPVFDLVDAAYRQRRKMLRSSLAGRVPDAAWGPAAVEPTDRPERLDVAAWARLASAVAACGTMPQ